MLPIRIYPYMNLEDLNLDYILKKLMMLETDVRDFVEMNAIKYADPIQWNITTQYEKNTIVIDPATGSAYLSVRSVPAGIDISRTEYWTEVFNLSALIQDAVRNLTEHDAGISTAATFASAPGDWIMWKDILYIATSQVTPGDAYTVGGNIARLTVEEAIKDIVALINQNAEAIAAEAETRAREIEAEAETRAREIADLEARNVTVRCVEDLIAFPAEDGQTIQTLEYYRDSAIGGAVYLITASEIADRFSIALSNGLYAHIPGESVSIAQMGAKPDAKYFDASQLKWFNDAAHTEAMTNNAPVLQEAVTKYLIVEIPAGFWGFEAPINVPRGREVRGAGKSATHLRFTTAAFKFPDYGTYCRFRDFTLSGKGTDDTSGRPLQTQNDIAFEISGGLSAGTTRNFEVRNVIINNFWFGVRTNDSLLWDCVFDNVEFQLLEEGFRQLGGDMSFDLAFNQCHFMTCYTRVIRLGNALGARFTGCNFGIQSPTAISNSGYLIGEFTNCNFECDALVQSSTKLALLAFEGVESKIRISYSNFQGRADANTYYVQGAGFMEIEGVRIVTSTALGNMSGEFFLPTAGVAPRLGAWSIKNTTGYVATSGWASGIMPFYVRNGNTNLIEGNSDPTTAHLNAATPGDMFYNTATNVIKYFNGSTLVAM